MRYVVDLVTAITAPVPGSVKMYSHPSSEETALQPISYVPPSSAATMKSALVAPPSYSATTIPLWKRRAEIAVYVIGLLQLLFSGAVFCAFTYYINVVDTFVPPAIAAMLGDVLLAVLGVLCMMACKGYKESKMMPVAVLLFSILLLVQSCIIVNYLDRCYDNWRPDERHYQCETGRDNQFTSVTFQSLMANGAFGIIFSFCAIFGSIALLA